MNAGAYGAEITDVLDWAEIVTRAGELLRLPVAGTRLRLSSLVAAAGCGGGARRGCAREPGDPALIAARIAEIRAARAGHRSRPARAPAARPSAIPAPAETDRKRLGADRRGRLPRALPSAVPQVSEKHCNFLLNTGNATAADLERLGETVRDAGARSLRHRTAMGNQAHRPAERRSAAG